MVANIPEACLENGCAKLVLRRAEAALEQRTYVEICPLMAQVALQSTGCETDRLLAGQVEQCSDGGRNIVRERPPSSANAVWAVVAMRRALYAQEAKELAA